MSYFSAINSSNISPLLKKSIEEEKLNAFLSFFYMLEDLDFRGNGQGDEIFGKNFYFIVFPLGMPGFWVMCGNYAASPILVDIA